MKRILALTLALLMILTLCACGQSAPSASGGASAPAAVSNDEQNAAVETGETNDLTYVEGYWPESFLKDRIVVATSRDGGGFPPIGGSAWGSVNFCLYEKLVFTDSEGRDRLQLLKSINELDELTYECELWDCIYDTAGNNITAEDVAFSVQLFIDSGNKGGVNCLNLLEGDKADIEVTGDYTFLWHNCQAFGPGELGKNMGNPTIVSKTAYEASGEDKFITAPVGTGPYMLESYTVGSKAVFKANPDYWMKNIDDDAWLAENFYAIDCQNVGEIEYDIIQDASTRAMALEMGDVCAIDTANAADINAYLADPAFGISPVRKRVGAPLAFYFDCSDTSPCSDVNLRMAICYALDNDGIAAGNSYPAYAVYGLQPNMFDAPESWTTGEGREYYGYDVDKAKEYLEKSSYNGEPLTLMYMDQAAITDMVIMMQSQLREVGIDLELQPVDQNTLDVYKNDYTKWDMIADIMGGGNYMANTIKKFWSGDLVDANGNTVLAILDTHLDELYEAVRADSSPENIEAWDQYFTYDNCYGYAIARYFEQTACLSTVNAVVAGAQNQLVPGAFTFND